MYICASLSYCRYRLRHFVAAATADLCTAVVREAEMVFEEIPFAFVYGIKNMTLSSAKRRLLIKLDLSLLELPQHAGPREMAVQ